MKDKLITELKILEEEMKEKLENLRNHSLVGPIIMGFLNLGLNENDISQSMEEPLFHKRDSSWRDKECRRDGVQSH